MRGSWSCARYADAKNLFLSQQEFVGLFNSHREVLAVLKESKLGQLPEMGISHAELLACHMSGHQVPYQEPS